MTGRTIKLEDLTVEDETKHCDCCRKNREHLRAVWRDGVLASIELEEINHRKNNTVWKHLKRWILNNGK